MKKLATAMQLVGLVILAAGAALLAPWLGLIVLGAGVIVAGVVLEVSTPATAGTTKES
jgi:hypothetical protein